MSSASPQTCGRIKGSLSRVLPVRDVRETPSTEERPKGDMAAAERNATPFRECQKIQRRNCL